MDNVLQVSERARKPVDSGHHQRVASEQEVENHFSSSRPAMLVPERFSERTRKPRSSALPPAARDPGRWSIREHSRYHFGSTPIEL